MKIPSSYLPMAFPPLRFRKHQEISLNKSGKEIKKKIKQMLGTSWLVGMNEKFI